MVEKGREAGPAGGTRPPIICSLICLFSQPITGATTNKSGSQHVDTLATNKPFSLVLSSSLLSSSLPLVACSDSSNLWICSDTTRTHAHTHTRGKILLHRVIFLHHVNVFVRKFRKQKVCMRGWQTKLKYGIRYSEFKSSTVFLVKILTLIMVSNAVLLDQCA